MFSKEKKGYIYEVLQHNEQKMITPYDIIGLAGISLSIFCYARVQWQRDYAKKLSFSLLNLTSSLLLAISLLKNWNLASFVSNAVWGFISAYGVYRCATYMWREKNQLRSNL